MENTYHFNVPPKKPEAREQETAARVSNDEEILKRVASVKTELPPLHDLRAGGTPIAPSFDKTGFYREHVNVGLSEAEIAAEVEAEKIRKEKEEREKREKQESERKEIQEKHAGKLKNYERIIQTSNSESEREVARKLYKAIAGKEYSGPNEVLGK